MHKDFDRIQNIIGLTLVEGVGHVLARRIITACGDPKDVFKHNANKLVQIQGIGEFVARKIVNAKDVLLRAQAEIDYCLKNNIEPLSYLDEKFPYRLLQCEDAPSYIFCKGNIELNAPRMLSIVGTRNPTAYGKAFTEKLVDDLKPYSVSVVSGMAYGIDITAHKQCVHNHIPTIGIVAHGLDTLYPASHGAIAAQMHAQGGLVTECLSGTAPDKENFPKRNRIVAGLCDATFVVETDLKGGSMITARLANDYNREVFALAGKPHEQKSKGCNFLIKTNRAALCEDANDIVTLMGWNEAFKKKQPAIQTQLFDELNAEEKQVLQLLHEKEKIMIDEICFNLNKPVSEVSVILLNLEFKNLVKSLPGKQYACVKM